MVNKLTWQDRYNIGVEVIDKEHKKLFSIINKLFVFSEQEEKSQWVCQEGIKYFKDHAMNHFAAEEVYMSSINYSGFEMHRRLHNDFRQKTLPALEKELELTDYSEDAVKHFLAVCAGWLLGHTLTEDSAITGKGRSKFVDLVPEETHIAMRQVIIQLLQEMFQLDARVISESYGGEKFGDGVYYRMVYTNKEGKPWEVFLVFEEKLLINTVGKMMGHKSAKMDVTLINAVRYVARQFVQSISEQFPFADMKDVKTENLLSYEQFSSVFEKNGPQFSMLFNTGEGYFAYCAMASHLLQTEVTTSIKAENAVAEITNYLKENQGTKKKKLLVVDDSSVVRESMQALLCEDYDVSVANSGLAAIKCITLNRPDLVLLDYEMPVCDGPQVLGMIRMEEEFADIPVFFVTGRADAESLKKVLSLKPAGYLLKTLKPEELKKNIDIYFEKKK